MQEVEIIVVDDGSTDETQSMMLKEFPTVIVLQRPENLPPGGNACRNLGLDIAKGKYLLFLDSDDLMQPHSLAKILPILSQSDTFGYIAEGEYFAEETGPFGFKGPLTPLAYLQNQTKWPISAAFWHAATLKKHQLKFDNTLIHGQEWLWHMQCLGTDQPMRQLNIPCTLIRSHKGNKSRNQSHIYWSNLAKSRRKAFWYFLKKKPFSPTLQIQLLKHYMACALEPFRARI
jgi:glycosyltransferase involved in cell wall biosynthesis